MPPAAMRVPFAEDDSALADGSPRDWNTTGTQLGLPLMGKAA